MSVNNSGQQQVVWTPLAGSQTLAISAPCNHVLYEGTRGPGKTDAQVMAFRKNVGVGYGAFWKGVIFDREYKNLDDLIAKTYRWFPKFNDGAKFLASKADYRWVWPTGEQLLFRQIKKEADYWNFHGQEFPFIGWNELTKYPSCKLYDMMMSCNRSSFIPAEHSPRDPKTGELILLPEMPLVVFSTTNPHGAGHNWVKARFIDAAPAGVIVRNTVEVFNPRTQQREPVTKTQVRIFGSYKENKFLSPEYILELETITDENRRRAWLFGDWDIVAGGALDDVWGPHCIKPRFPVPRGWRLDRSFDWGSTHPFSVGWWAEANGEEVTLPDGTKWAPRRGSLIRCHEWYGTRKMGSNEGLMMSARDIALGIRKTDEQLIKDGWIQSRPMPGPADNQIRDVREKDVDSIEVKMAAAGVTWTASDKGPGSRRNGLQLLRDMLQASKTGEAPGIFFMEHCRATISTLPVLPRDPDNEDDVDTEAEDHVYDEIRYRVLAKSRQIKTQPLLF